MLFREPRDGRSETDRPDTSRLTIDGLGSGPRSPARLCAVRYFTDFIDGRGLSRDEDGLSFADDQDACHAAAEALVEVMHDRIRCGSERPKPGAPVALNLEAMVRDETGRVVFRGRLALDLEWPLASSERAAHQPQFGTGG